MRSHKAKMGQNTTKIRYRFLFIYTMDAPRITRNGAGRVSSPARRSFSMPHTQVRNSSHRYRYPKKRKRDERITAVCGRSENCYTESGRAKFQSMSYFPCLGLHPYFCSVMVEVLFHIYLYKYNPSTSFSQKGKERDRSLGPNCTRVDADARGRRLNVTLTILKFM